MHAILKLEVILLIFTLIECNSTNNKLESKSDETETKITVYFHYTCTDDSKIKELKSKISIKDNVGCTGIYEHKVSLPFEVIFNKRDQCDGYERDDHLQGVSRRGEKIKYITFEDLDELALHIEGNVYLNISGTLYDSECGDGEIAMEAFLNNNDCKTCKSKKGVTKLETNKATLEIKGGKCQSSCHGEVKVEYNPGLKDRYYRDTNDQNLQKV